MDKRDGHWWFGFVLSLHIPLPTIEEDEKEYIGVDHVHVRIFWIGRFEHADDFISLSKRCFLVVFTQIVTRNER